MSVCGCVCFVCGGVEHCGGPYCEGLKNAEQWREIPGYEGRYEASDQGRIRSLSRIIHRSDGRKKTYHGKVRSQALTPTGRYHVKLRDGRGEDRQWSVHRLILLAFVGPSELLTRHLNGDPQDNRLENLRYGTASENELDKRVHGTDHNVNKTHCMYGHEYAGDNLAFRRGSNARRCRTCSRDNNRRRREQERLARATLAYAEGGVA